MRAKYLPMEYQCPFCNNPKAIKTCYSHNGEFFTKEEIEKYSKGPCNKCRYELQKKSNLEKYGVTNISCLQSTKEKVANTVMKKYGVSNVFKSEEIKSQIKETCLEKYGKESFTQTEEYIKKTKETNFEKYGTEWQTQAENWHIKIKETNQRKFGVDFITQSEYFKEKATQTCLEKFGVENASSCEEIKQKKREIWKNRTSEELAEINLKTKETLIKHYGSLKNAREAMKEKVAQTCLERYGVRTILETEECRRLARISKHIHYDNEWFDSKWEVIFYRYHKEILKENVIHESRGYEYFYNNRKHRYFPDFEIDGQLYEVKGDHLLDENDNLVVCYKNDTQEAIDAKNKLMKELNVKIIKEKDIKLMSQALKDNSLKQTPLVSIMKQA